MEATVCDSTNVELFWEVFPCHHYFDPFLPPVDDKAFCDVARLVDLITAMHSCVRTISAEIRHDKSVMLGKIIDEGEPSGGRCIHVIAT